MSLKLHCQELDVVNKGRGWAVAFLRSSVKTSRARSFNAKTRPNSPGTNSSPPLNCLRHRLGHLAPGLSPTKAERECWMDVLDALRHGVESR